ncbi:MAG: hypothetical protein CM1200mP20_12830 [Pseudomonadota bacterium]|nr:MAG: hypothetical protein CM1200mP20_12830 [Pseudomonadota bacterium]
MSATSVILHSRPITVLLDGCNILITHFFEQISFGKGRGNAVGGDPEWGQFAGQALNKTDHTALAAL